MASTCRDGVCGGDGARVLEGHLQVAAIVERREAAARRVAELAHLRWQGGVQVMSGMQYWVCESSEASDRRSRIQNLHHEMNIRVMVAGVILRAWPCKVCRFAAIAERAGTMCQAHRRAVPGMGGKTGYLPPRR